MQTKACCRPVAIKADERETANAKVVIDNKQWLVVYYRFKPEPSGVNQARSLNTMYWDNDTPSGFHHALNISTKCM